VNLAPVDLGVCLGAEWDGGGERTAIVLPGRMLGGAPSTYYTALTLFREGWRVVQVWDGWDGDGDPVAWARERAEAALAHAGDAQLVVAKSLSTLLTGFAADRGLAGLWLTPLLTEDGCVEGLRRKTAPALLVGGTNDPTWDGALARELGDDVLEIAGADHGLAEIEHLPLLNDAVRTFAARL
jgi:hypothetical protein